MVTFITRGRNKITNSLVIKFSQKDYNFDFRAKSKLLALIKMLITSFEVDVRNNDTVIFEGLMCALISNFMPKRSHIFILYANGLDFAISKKNSKLKHLILRFALRKIDKVLAISKLVACDAKLILPKTEVINVGFLSSKNLKPSPKKNNRKLSKTKKYVVALDRPFETGFIKGLDLAISIFRTIKKNDANVELHIVGQGTEKLIFNDDDNFHCHGFVEMHLFLPTIDYALILSRYDAFNLFGLECIMHGVTPIFSNTVGLAIELGIPKKYLIVNGQLSNLNRILNSNDYKAYINNGFLAYEADLAIAGFYDKFINEIGYPDET